MSAAQRMLKTEQFDLCLTDMQLPDGDGLELVKWIQQYSPSVPVAVITAHGNMETAVRALKLGAFDFVSKPLDLSGLRKLVTAAIKLSGSNDGDTSVFGPRLLGTSPAMQNMREMIARVARSQAPVHIFGESGTGKELVATFAHSRIGTASQPGRSCLSIAEESAIPTELMEGETIRPQTRQLHRRRQLTRRASFNRRRAARCFSTRSPICHLFTCRSRCCGSSRRRPGAPVGEQLEVGVDVRVLSATHKRLAKLVAEGKFPRGSILSRERDRASECPPCVNVPRICRNSPRPCCVAWAAA